MKHYSVIFILVLCSVGCRQQGSSGTYITHRAPLIPNAYMELPLGAIRPEGWLKERLIRQKNGLTGHLDELYPLVMGKSNGWLGGDGDQWERGPYWMDGLLPLAYILNDSVLQNKVNQWIEWTLNSQREDGYFGPQRAYPDTIPGVQRDNPDDWWPKMVMLKVLRQYYSATNDERVIPFMTKYFHYQLNQLPLTPLDFRTFWPRYRGGDNLMVVLWLYNITGDKALLKLADLLYEQTFDYVGTFARKNWWKSGNMHCVNLAQGLKTPAVYAQYRNRDFYLQAAKSGFEDIQLFLGYPHGGFGGDEALHGNNPTQGTELCTLVELMFSLEQMLQISGDTDYADHIERIAFNALPAQSDDDYLNRQYFQQTNQVCITKHDRNFDTNHAGNDILFGRLNGYPCCTSNMHQGFPKFTRNLWYATPDKGLAAMLYAPCSVTAHVGEGVPVTIEEITHYPFSGHIALKISSESSVTFPLYLRIPSWCKQPLITLNGKSLATTNASEGVACIDRRWQSGDQVDIEFPMEVRLTTWYERAVAVERGPLVYGLKMDEVWSNKPFEGEEARWHGDDYWEVTSSSKWNYALIERTPECLAAHYRVILRDEIPAFPWNTDNAPIRIETEAFRLPQWQLYNGSAGPIPYSLAYGMPYGEKDSIVLIPYGCTKLRIAEFPMVGQYHIK